MSESLHLTRNGPILEITLDRPKRMPLTPKPALQWVKLFLISVTIRNYA